MGRYSYRTENLLDRAAASDMAQHVSETFEQAGWLFESESHPMLSTKECDELTGRLEEACEGVAPPTYPGALFGRNRLTLKNKASGFALSFDAEGAIACWARESARHGSGGLKVLAASQGSWTQVAQEVSASDYDWTFSSDYCGTTSSSAAAPGAACTRASNTPCKGR